MLTILSYISVFLVFMMANYLVEKSIFGLLSKDREPRRWALVVMGPLYAFLSMYVGVWFAIILVDNTRLYLSLLMVLIPASLLAGRDLYRIYSARHGYSNVKILMYESGNAGFYDQKQDVLVSRLTFWFRCIGLWAGQVVLIGPAPFFYQ